MHARDHASAAASRSQPRRSPARLSTVPSVLRSPGRPLDEPLRKDMEARLGVDFSDVRVHTDQAARLSAAEIDARAYTAGSDVVLGAGGDDRRTLVHELVHVVQQRVGSVSGSETGHGFRVSDPADRFEREADTIATSALTRTPKLWTQEPAQASQRPVQVVQRVGLTDTEWTAHATFASADLYPAHGGNIISLRTTRSGGQHAEQKLVDDIENGVANGTVPSGHYKLLILLNRSPCVDCARRLVRLKLDGLQYPNGHWGTFAIEILAAHNYGKSNYARAESVKVNEFMQAVGIELEVSKPSKFDYNVAVIVSQMPDIW